MKRVAGMQPYFFPYLGYWQLIDAVDVFVIFDEAQYIKQGWINRNRVLKPDGGWQYIQVPVVKHPMSTSICDVQIVPDRKWKDRILNQLTYYQKRAPFYRETAGTVEAILMSGNEQLIGQLNSRIVHEVCAILAISSRIIISSSYHFDYSEVKASRNWALAHAMNLGATELINPRGGFHLLDKDQFRAHGVGLSILEIPEITYSQSQEPFEPYLSIIDVLMYNGIERTRELIAQRKIIRCLEAA
jgi:hypothetical protein